MSIVCFIDKDGKIGTCSEEVKGKLQIDCSKCSFKKKFEGKEKEHFSYCAWKGEIKKEE